MIATITLMEQNPQTGSKWAKLKLAGHDVVQVSINGAYYGVFVDGDLTQILAALNIRNKRVCLGVTHG